MDSDSVSSKSKTPRTPQEIEKINQTVLSLARKYFALKNFDQVRLEDIAKQAETSVSHIMRTFGSKEELFKRCIDQQFKLWDMMKSDRAKLGERLAKYVTAPIKDGDQLQHVLLFIRGSLHSDSHKTVRDQFEAQFLNPYAQWLGGDGASARSGIITSFLFGITYMHYICDCEPFNGPELEKLQKIVAPLLQKLIDGEAT
ncbi:MAG: TetR family transcriptional regulator [Bdellovibrionota bacterium]